MSQLFDAYGNPIGVGPAFKLDSVIDPSLKIFEGSVKTKFYKDRIIAEGQCWHCSGRVEHAIRISKAQARALERDKQFAKNMFDLLCNKLQENHQCKLLDDGKDSLSDLTRWLERERAQA